MRILAKTDIGKAREMNQDSFFASKADDEIKLFILADGMGGYKGGEIASSIAVFSTQGYISNNFKTTPKDRNNILKLIRDSIEYANLMVYEKAKESSDLKDMGTTIEACLIYNNRAYIGHVGDSRIYRIRKNIIRKLTNDHSYVQQLVKEGKITREEAENHPKKNMLVKALGCKGLVGPDTFSREFQKDDIILMCSDGLTNMVSEKEIYKILLENSEKPEIALINKANKEGGVDNITVIIVDNVDDFSEEVKK